MISTAIPHPELQLTLHYHTCLAALLPLGVITELLLQVWAMQSNIPNFAEDGPRSAGRNICEAELQQIQQRSWQTAWYAFIRLRFFNGVCWHPEIVV